MLTGDADFIFQQDLAPAHTAKSTKTWFNNHGTSVLDWPANSLDLNPIENLWCIIQRKVRDSRPNNTDELKATIRVTWASITPQQYHRLITFMPRPIDEIINSKVSQTKYQVHTLTYFSNGWHYLYYKSLFWVVLCNILIFWDSIFRFSWAACHKNQDKNKNGFWLFHCMCSASRIYESFTFWSELLK